MKEKGSGFDRNITTNINSDFKMSVKTILNEIQKNVIYKNVYNVNANFFACQPIIKKRNKTVI